VKNYTDLFDNVFEENLSLYKDIVYPLEYNDFEEIAEYVSSQFATFREFKEDEEELIPYEAYPSLKCPTPCNYELDTWTTLFGLAVGIFALTLITIALYSLFLKKQYSALKSRKKNIKISKVNSEQIENE